MILRLSLTCGLLLGLLTGCASLPPPTLPAREKIRDFSLDARFALRATPPGQASQSSGGRTADGQERESSDPDALIEELTGLRLPVARLPAWLTGRTGGEAEIESDAAGRPARLHEAGWQIDYFYDDNRPGALPARLHISLPGEIDLKLRIEEWRALP